MVLKEKIEEKFKKNFISENSHFTEQPLDGNNLGPQWKFGVMSFGRRYNSIFYFFSLCFFLLI